MVIKVIPPDEAKKRVRANLAAWKRQKALQVAKSPPETITGHPEGKQASQMEQSELDRLLRMALVNREPSDVVKGLLEDGADPNHRDENSCTPLMIACQIGNLETALALLRKGAEVEAASDQGVTALMKAAEHGHADLVEHLVLFFKADVNRKDMRGRTPLMYASAMGQRGTALLLLGFKADADAHSNDGMTALIWASQHDHPKLVDILLTKGASINACSWDGRTALMVGSAMGSFHSVRLLLERGATPNMRDFTGMSALKLAIENGYHHIEHVLRQHGAKE